MYLLYCSQLLTTLITTLWKDKEDSKAAVRIKMIDGLIINLLMAFCNILPFLDVITEYNYYTIVIQLEAQGSVCRDLR